MMRRIQSEAAIPLREDGSVQENRGCEGGRGRGRWSVGGADRRRRGWGRLRSRISRHSEAFLFDGTLFIPSIGHVDGCEGWTNRCQRHDGELA